MSQPIDQLPPEDQAPGAAPGHSEEVDALPVLSEGETVIRARRIGAAIGDRRSGAAMMPAVQAAAVAAGGFVAGAAVVGLVHRRQRRAAVPSKGRRANGELARGSGRGRRSAKAVELVQIVGSRS